MWSLLLAVGYLKVLSTAAGDNVWYTLALTNFEVRQMFRRMVKGWFQGSTTVVYNEFKVLSPYEGEKTLEETLASAHAQIEERHYEAELLSEGFTEEQIRKYGFAFQGKKCLIG